MENILSEEMIFLGQREYPDGNVLGPTDSLGINSILTFLIFACKHIHTYKHTCDFAAEPGENWTI